MALWPFRRRSSRKRPRSGANLSDVEGAGPSRAQTEGNITRAGSKKKQRTESPTFQRRQRTYSFSPGRRDSIRVERSQNQARANRHVQQATSPIAEMSEPAWDRTPTLHHQRTKDQLSRRKSSKKRKEVIDREAEIKAMSGFTPTRPAADSWQAGRPIRRDSKRARTIGPGRLWNDPASDVSLPLPGSIHSTMSSDSEYGSYKISALSSLAPRPTLRYTHEQRWRPSQSSMPARTGSQKQKVAERMQIPKEVLNANKRIDDLADDLDAGELRELLERDERRRERKRQLEQEKIERRLARRAERQRKEEAEAQRNGTPSPENLERGVMGRELVGLGIDPPSTVVTSSKQRTPEPSDAPADEDTTSAKRPSDHFEPLETPAVESAEPAQKEDTQDKTEAKPSLETADPPEPEGQQDIPTATTAPALAPPSEVEPESVGPSHSVYQASASSQPSLLAGLLRSKKTRSKSTLNSDRDRQVSSPPSRIDEEGPQRKSSVISSAGGRFSFSSLVRWGSKGRRSSRPSSFSNTSREEMQAVAAAHARTQSPAHSTAQAHALAQAQALARLQGDSPSPTPEPLTGNYLARKSSIPKRTRSRFREDLPDFPLSPPDSRVQSPEADVPPLPAVAEQNVSEMGARPMPIPRYDTPTSDHRQPSTQLPSPEPQMSMSMASIDSEASWLSGRMGSKRASTVRDTLAKTSHREEEEEDETDSPSNSTQEDLAIADDDYMSRLTPKYDRNLRQASVVSGEGRPSSDEGDFDAADMKWGAVGARAEMVHSHVHDRQTMKSREGFLDMDTYDQESIAGSSPTSYEKADVQRARSVNLGNRGHARNFSAGSAKIFEITRSSSDRRRSMSQKRQSTQF